ncbi:MAG: KEOPS complex subunit Cgi121 [archaeon]
MKTYIFKTNKKSYFLNIIYCSIDINDIENYLKRIERAKKSQKSKTNLIVIPNYKIFSLEQLKWAVFVAKNKFLEKINVSKSLWNEIILTLCATDQINRISKNWYLKNGNNKNVFLITLSENKIDSKEINKIKKELGIEEIKINEIEFNKKEVLELYKISDVGLDADVENKVIEKMS